MADSERENTIGVVDKRYSGKTNTGALPLSSRGSYDDVTSLRTALTTANGSYFTSARLNGMTKNDMVYALRLANDAGGI